MNFLKKHITLILLSITTVIGLLLRLRLINSGDFWLDEAFTGIFVRANWSDMYKMIITDFVHPPMYYTAVKLWTELFNSTSVITIRLFSILFGTILIPLSYIFMNFLLEGKKKYVSVITAFVFAVNPFFISYSIEARSYALLAVLGLLTTIVFIKLLRENKISINKTYVSFVILSLLLVSTHYISALFLLSLGISYLLIKPKSLQSVRDTLQLFLPSVLTIGGVMIGFLLLREGFVEANEFSTSSNVGWIPKAGIYSIPLSIYNFLFGVQAQNMGMPMSNVFRIEAIQPQETAILIYTALIVSIFVLLKKKVESTKLIYLLSISFLPILLVILISYLGVQMYIERYMIIFGVGVILLIMYLLSKSSMLVTGILLLTYTILLLIINPTNPITRYSDICSNVNGSNLLVDDPGEYILLEYYCDRSNILLFTNNRDFYKNWWLVIGYENTVDRIDDESTYLIKRNSEVETQSEWEDIKNIQVGIYEYLTLYKIK